MILNFLLIILALLAGFFTGVKVKDLKSKKWAFWWKFYAKALRKSVKQFYSVLEYEGLSKKEYAFIVSNSGYLTVDKAKMEELDKNKG